ncbi:MAG: hypothetical protein JJT88_17395 [Gammaproteobacteria bacterium]|nr:hypothetical protein [Gammaproteobacteria bacterium]
MSRIAVERLARQQRRPGPDPGEPRFQAAELLHLPTLAASSHNSQPWRFRIDDSAIRIVPDCTRRLPIVDPDDAHLLRSLGCAAENLVHAAAAQGFASQIIATDDGLASRVFGKPALPGWLGRRLLPNLLSPDSQTRRDAEAIRSASGIAVIIAQGNRALDWIRSGIVAQRLLLEAEFHDVRTALLNQPIEASGVNSTFRSWLGVSGWPMLLIRFGRAGRAPYSLRRPVADVIDVGT